MGTVKQLSLLCKGKFCSVNKKFCTVNAKYGAAKVLLRIYLHTIAIGAELQDTISIDRTNLSQEFMMHPAIAIEENSEQNPHICPNFPCFFFGHDSSGRFHWNDWNLVSMS